MKLKTLLLFLAAALFAAPAFAQQPWPDVPFVDGDCEAVWPGPPAYTCDDDLVMDMTCKTPLVAAHKVDFGYAAPHYEAACDGQEDWQNLQTLIDNLEVSIEIMEEQLEYLHLLCAGGNIPACAAIPGKEADIASAKAEVEDYEDDQVTPAWKWGVFLAAGNGFMQTADTIYLAAIPACCKINGPPPPPIPPTASGPMGLIVDKRVTIYGVII